MKFLNDMSGDVLTLKPSLTAYHSLGDIDIVSKKVTKEDIESLGRIIRDHGLQQLVGITILHRHFDLEPEQILLETINYSNRVSTVRPHQIEGIDCKPVSFMWSGK